ncbi:MAG: hypothetical protein U9N40_02675 [Euryarchaeota archaeon]|nr:hypothetical protein [Euryarchaeota archaeon]
MIFPAHCKYVGIAASKPVGEKVYFLSRYLILETTEGYEIIEVEAEPDETGMMRKVRSFRILAEPKEVYVHPGQVNLHNRRDLIKKALGSERRCTVFTGIDEHMTFVLDPDPDEILTIHLYDIRPPRPNLSETVISLEETGIFGELQVQFEHHVADITELQADVYPCRAAGFDRTLDSDELFGGETVAGCMTARQILDECYGTEFPVIDICPVNAVLKEPFIARCCRSERTGTGKYNHKSGTVVHWGASPKQVVDAVFDLVREWRKTGGSR